MITVITAVSTLIAYVSFIKFLRIKRAKYIKNIKEPEEVYKMLFSVEFPFIWLKGLELALFNTFGYLPVYARLNLNKKFVSEPELRYDDTELLLREAWEHGVNSERGQKAMNRLNYIHSHFNIDNRSYLYVLALFVVTPVRLINEFGFRKLTKHEINSTCKAITLMGSAMKITDLPISFEDYEKIVDEEYKGNRMKLDEKKRGRIVADSVLKMFLGQAPSFIHPFASKIVFSLLDDEIRESLGYPKQPKIVRHFAKAVLLIRAYTIKFFFPIRLLSQAVLRTPNKVGDKPRFQKYRKTGCPFSYEKGYKCENLGKWTKDDAVKQII